MALEQRAIGRNIARLRERKHLSQERIAELIGVSERSYQDWEYGKAQPRWRNLERLAEVLGVSEEEILGTTTANGVTQGIPARLERIEEAIEGLRDLIVGELGARRTAEPSDAPGLPREEETS